MPLTQLNQVVIMKIIEQHYITRFGIPSIIVFNNSSHWGKCMKLMASKVAIRPSTMQTHKDVRAIIQAHARTYSWRLGHTQASMSAANMSDTSARMPLR